MNKVGLTLLTAVFGGAVALGGYKLIENKKFDGKSFEDKQKVYFANNPVGAMSSTGNPDFTQAAAAVSPGVVHIKTTYTRKGSQESQGSPFDMFEEFFGMPQGGGRRQMQSQPIQASGSGVIISDDGYIVTNNHVVEDADKIEVVLTDKRTFEAKLIGRDPNTDIALLKVAGKGLPVVKLGNSDNVNVGEWVLAFGYPLGLQSTVTAGIVSATGRDIGILREGQQQRGNPFGGNTNQPLASSAIESFIQTDAVINKGNSGGALTNAAGELIGINSAIASPTGVYAGYGFAIPVNLVKKIADDFVEFGNVKRGYIGINYQPVTSELAKERGITDVNGLFVEDVVAGGAAEAAGIKKGDILTKINGKVITGSPVLGETIGRLRPGDKVNITYKRDGKEKQVSLTLKGEESLKTASASGKASKSATEIYNKLGASFIPASAQKKKELGVNSGVVVTQVNRGGIFDYFGVERGLVITEVNGKAVNTVDDVEAALGATQRNIVRLKGVSPQGGAVQLSFPVEY
ncbi:Do family serine endopeptidase [Sphingobacterium siyangense]|uniref:Do family serine endopeptidase n=1 Tax=Sphingobacterium TaxID=28453 RepID=UPI000958844B|nr:MULTISPECIES: Do family serine endopeptidase [Sphingobacterium]APU99442.1 serine protease [Sphingobacterium sp. B29]UQA75120.1 Do family serine endopeptidase [Sphingobacterium siyangense]